MHEAENSDARKAHYFRFADEENGSACAPVQANTSV
jgi:hypothetical protein